MKTNNTKSIIPGPDRKAPDCLTGRDRTRAGQNLKLEDKLQEALKLHQTGNLDDASVIYNKILEDQPDNIDAISLLGTLNLQTENLDEARVLLKKSLALKPENATTHNNRGSALQASGRFQEAITSYKQAIDA